LEDRGRQFRWRRSLESGRQAQFGRRILDDLEARAHRNGYSTVRLETGSLQPGAIRLYESAGYHRIENYGVYQGNPQSICFEKTLT
jgi:putative acetyltransferase